MDDQTLIELVEKAKKQDEAAMRALIEDIQDRLFKFCMYLTHNESVAQDLCQETLIRLLQRISQLDKPERFQSWTFRIAKNLYLDWRKSPKSSGHINIDEVDPAQLSTDDNTQEQLMTLMKGLSQLETPARAVILLIDLEGYSYAEAGEILSLSESAVRSRLHRARQDLEIILTKK